MDLIWIMMGFFAFITLVFIAVAYFLPEWVGITGKKALEIEKHQQGEAVQATDSSSPNNSNDSST